MVSFFSQCRVGERTAAIGTGRSTGPKYESVSAGQHVPQWLPEPGPNLLKVADIRSNHFVQQCICTKNPRVPLPGTLLAVAMNIDDRIVDIDQDPPSVDAGHHR